MTTDNLSTDRKRKSLTYQTLNGLRKIKYGLFGSLPHSLELLNEEKCSFLWKVHLQGKQQRNKYLDSKSIDII